MRNSSSSAVFFITSKDRHVVITDSVINQHLGYESVRIYPHIDKQPLKHV
jgi:hypothetical protein